MFCFLNIYYQLFLLLLPGCATAFLFRLAFLEETLHRLLGGPGEGDTSRTDELEDTHFLQFLVETLRLVGVSRFLDNGEGTVHLDDPGIVPREQVFQVPAIQQFVRRHLVQGKFAVDDLFVGIIEGLDHIHPLLDLKDGRSVASVMMVMLWIPSMEDAPAERLQMLRLRRVNTLEICARRPIWFSVKMETV